MAITSEKTREKESKGPPTWRKRMEVFGVFSLILLVVFAFLRHGVSYGLVLLALIAGAFVLVFVVAWVSSRLTGRRINWW